MKTVYVSDGGTGIGDSAQSPAGTLDAAVNALNGAGGSIILCGNTTVSSALILPEQSGNLTFTAESGSLVLAADFGFEKNTNANDVTLDLPVTVTANGGAAIFGGFNSVTFGANFTVIGNLDFFGGVDCATGVNSDDNTEFNRTMLTELPYDIIVNAGTFRTFCGGNRRSSGGNSVGSIAAPITITVNSGTFGGSVSYDVASNNKKENAFSISGMSILADDAVLTINGGTFNLPIYAQGRLGLMATNAGYCSPLTASSNEYYAIDGDITLNIAGGTFKGGEISAFQTSTGYTQLLRGNFDLTVGENAVLENGTVVDATQVKAYAGESNRAAVTYPVSSAIVVKRFDIENGVAQTYTEPLRISCVGDSITEGVGSSDPVNTSYSARILALAETAGDELVIGNYGVGGSTVFNYNYTSYVRTLAYKIAYYEADGNYVVIGLGTNDAATAGGTTAQTLNFENAYREFVTSFGELASTERVFATSAIYRYTSKKAADIRTVSIIRPLQKLVMTALESESNKYVFVDLYAILFDAAVNDTLFASDKLHPDDGGYVLYGQAIYDAVFNNVYNVPNFGMTDIYLSENGRLNGAGTSEDPISSLPVAFGLAKGEATIHLIGSFTYSEKIVTPIGLDKLTIVGEGSGATLAINGDTVKFQSDVKLDNFILTSTVTSPYLTGCFNSIELTPTFDCSSSYRFVAGELLFGDNSANAAYDSLESASSSKNAAVTVNGGHFSVFLGGNYRLSSNSPFGTYSGNMTLTIGTGATIAANGMNGIGGQNYLSGTMTAYVNSWPAGQLCRDYARVGVLDTPSRFNEVYNTGATAITLGEGVNALVVTTGDFNGDGVVNFADALIMLRYVLNGFDTSTTLKAHSFYSNTTVTLSNVLRAMKKLVM